MVTTFFNGGTSGGSTFGQSATDLVSFHNATPCDQAAAIVSISTSVVLSVCGVYGFTSAQGNALVVAVNAILACLNEKGLIAS